MNGSLDHVHVMRDLADWQLMDCDDRIIGKVDDVVFTVDAEGPPALTSVLSGALPLARRFGGTWTRNFEWFSRRFLGEAVPLDIPVGVIERKPSDLTVDAARDALERYRGDPAGPGVLRLTDLVGAQLVAAHDEPCGRVADLWLTGGPALEDLRLEGLIVGAGAIGDRLGYGHRAGPRGPFGLDWLYRRLGRATRFLPWSAVTVIEPRAVRTDLEARDLARLDEQER